MNCRLPIDLDRYRRLKDKGKVSPRVGAAVVGSSPAKANTSLTSSPSHPRSMMPIANAYRSTPDTPPVASPLSCSSTFQRANCNSDEANNVKKITAVSLFDDSRRERYAKFRSRVRDSQSHKTHQDESPVLQRTPEHEQREEQYQQAQQQDDERITSIESYYEDLNDDKYAMKRVVTHHEPERHDKYSYSDSLQKNDKQDSGRTPSVVSPSKRSAFKTPKYFSRRQRQSPAKKFGSSSTNRFPSPPSVTPSQQLSNHPLNSVGLPIAASRRDHATPRKAEGNQSNFRSVIKLENAKGVHSLPSTALLSEKPAQQPINGIYNFGLPTSGRQSLGLQREQSNHERPRPEDPYRSKPFPVGTTEIRKKPILAINTTSTPTSKPPTLAQSSSSLERGVTPPPFRPPNSKTPISFEGSQETTSTERRDRILEARGMEHSSGLLDSREPLGEMQRIPMDSRVNIRESSPHTPRPAHERPYNGAKALSEPQLKTPVKNASELSHNENTPRGVTPLDFYRRITAEKSRQVARARELSGSTPTKDFPSPSRLSTPVFRANSPRSFSAPVLDQRTVRLLYSKEFNQMIREHSKRQTSKLLEQYSTNKNSRRGAYGISLFARKRPLLEDEIVNGEFDVVNATTGRSNTMIIYITSMLSDLQTKDIQPKLFMFDHVFSEDMLAEEIYIRMAQAEVMRARDGGAASFVFFGSQGSGKTHCMADIEERIAYDLFESSRGPRPGFVAVQYLELSGSRIVDLLGPSNNLVRIVNEGTSYRLKGSTTKSASSPRDLLTIISDARRRLNNTSANQLQQDPPGYVLCHISVDLQWTKGTLILLECPASEMTRSRDGSGMFNGLMARIKAKGERRSKDSLFQGENNITKIMYHVLENPKGRISVLASISPASSDTEQTTAVLESLSSLAAGNVQNEPTRNVTVASPHQQGNDSPKSVTSSGEVPLPRQWSQVELEEWMRRKNLLVRSVPPDINGRVAMRMTKGQLKGTFYNVTDDAKAERLYMALRAENDRVARMRVKVRMARERQEMME